MGVLDKLFKPKETVNKKPIAGELGAATSADWSTTNNYRQVSKLTLAQLEEMKKDPTIKMGLFVTNMLIRSRFRSYVNKKPELQTFVRQNLSKIKFRKQLRKMLTYRWAGASITEKCWEYNNGKIELSKLITYWPNTWYSKGIPKDELSPVMQKVGYDWKDIPQEKVIILMNHDEFGENGSLLDGSVYDFYTSKYANLTKWDDALDRFGSPSLHGKINVQGFASLNDKMATKGASNTDSRKSATDAFAGFLAQFRTKNKVLVTDDTSSVEPISISDVGDNYITKVNYDDKMIMRAMMIPALLIDSDMKNGSLALSEKQFDYFWLLMEGELNSLNDELVEQMVRPLLDYNFKVVDNDYGHFNLDDLQEKDYVTWMNIFMQLTNAGYLNPMNQWHVRYVMEYLNMLDNEIDVDDATEASKKNINMLNNTILPRDQMNNLNTMDPKTLNFNKK